MADRTALIMDLGSLRQEATLRGDDRAVAILVEAGRVILADSASDRALQGRRVCRLTLDRLAFGAGPHGVCRMTSLNSSNPLSGVVGETMGPCPFCGGSPSEISPSPTLHTGAFSVECVDCGTMVRVDAGTRHDAIAAWNRRSSSPETPTADADSEPWFGCFTGDCPHGIQAECDAAIRAEFARMERVEHRLETSVAEAEGLIAEIHALSVPMPNSRSPETPTATAETPTAFGEDEVRWEVYEIHDGKKPFLQTTTDEVHARDFYRWSRETYPDCDLALVRSTTHRERVP